MEIINNIQENNKLIADFINPNWKKWVVQEVEEDQSYSQIIGDRIITRNMQPSDLKFHESWDDLMPVVEKIENLKNKEGSYAFSVRIGRDYCIVAYNDLTAYEIVVKSVHNNKIQSVYECIVEFIKWYNKNKENGK